MWWSLVTKLMKASMVKLGWNKFIIILPYVEKDWHTLSLKLCEAPNVKIMGENYLLHWRDTAFRVSRSELQSFVQTLAVPLLAVYVQNDICYYSSSYPGSNNIWRLWGKGELLIRNIFMLKFVPSYPSPVFVLFIF